MESTFCVELTVTTDPIAEPDSGAVVRMGSTRAQGSFCVRKRSARVGWLTSEAPEPDTRGRAALARLQARRLRIALADVIYEFRMRRGLARGADRPDLCASAAPARARQADATRRRGARRLDSLIFLLLIGLGLLLTRRIGACSLQPIDR